MNSKEYKKVVYEKNSKTQMKINVLMKEYDTLNSYVHWTSNALLKGERNLYLSISSILFLFFGKIFTDKFPVSIHYQDVYIILYAVITLLIFYSFYRMSTINYFFNFQMLEMAKNEIKINYLLGARVMNHNIEHFENIHLKYHNTKRFEGYFKQHFSGNSIFYLFLIFSLFSLFIVVYNYDYLKAIVCKDKTFIFIFIGYPIILVSFLLLGFKKRLAVNQLYKHFGEKDFSRHVISSTLSKSSTYVNIYTIDMETR